MSTKIHAYTNALSNGVRLLVSGSQAGGYPQTEALLGRPHVGLGYRQHELLQR